MPRIVAPDPCQMVKIGGTVVPMRKTTLALTALLAASASAVLGQASANIAAGRAQPSPLAPSEIVANAPKTDWAGIAASDLLVMDLTPDAKGKPRRVVIQLMPPPFSQGWIGNIRKLAATHWWDGTAINRVQDNYVVQWGDPDADDKTKAKALPAGLVTVPESNYVVRANWKTQTVSMGEIACPDGIGAPSELVFCVGQKSFKRRFENITGASAKTNIVTFSDGFPIEISRSDSKSKAMSAWPVHCYGMVGVGRDLSPNTGTGAELYTVIGHAPRHLDRNIALVGRVIEGIEFLSSLPRGHGALGFYDLAQGDERTGIVAIRIGTEVAALPAFEYLSTESQSFAAYADARANRRDAFFIRPAGGADICNIPVPVRRVK
jgi:cyclophilin family peptidyl-prolyl cis-trans isomerase